MGAHSLAGRSACCVAVGLCRSGLQTKNPQLVIVINHAYSTSTYLLCSFISGLNIFNFIQVSKLVWQGLFIILEAIQQMKLVHLHWFSHQCIWSSMDRLRRNMATADCQG